MARPVGVVRSRASVSDTKPTPYHRPAALPLHPLLLLDRRRSAGSHVDVRGFFPALPDHVCSTRPRSRNQGQPRRSRQPTARLIIPSSRYCDYWRPELSEQLLYVASCTQSDAGQGGRNLRFLPPLEPLFFPLTRGRLATRPSRSRRADGLTVAALIANQEALTRTRLPSETMCRFAIVPDAAPVGRAGGVWTTPSGSGSSLAWL